MLEGLFPFRFRSGEPQGGRLLTLYTPGFRVQGLGVFRRVRGLGLWAAILEISRLGWGIATVFIWAPFWVEEDVVYLGLVLWA